jgi:hypothetical protein
MEGNLNSSAGESRRRKPPASSPNEVSIEQEPAGADPFAYMLSAFDEEEASTDILTSDDRPPGHVRTTSEGIRLADAPCDESIEEGDTDRPTENDGSDGDDYSEVDSDMIREATEAAIEDAVAMKRSDSILSTESNEDSASSHSASDRVTKTQNQHISRMSSASNRYMEEASFEAAILSPGTHIVMPHGKLQNDDMQDSSSDIALRQSNNSSRTQSIHELEGNDSSTWDGMLSPSQRRSSERGVFKKQSSGITSDSVPFLETITSMDVTDGFDEESETTNDDSLVEILRACELVIPTTDSSDHRPQEVHLLHLVFKDFCQPPVPISAVERIFEKERNNNRDAGNFPCDVAIDLPRDVVIENPTPTLVRLLGVPLLRLPREWAMSFFRILLRLLTSESDAEYDAAVLSSCPWYDQTFGSSPASLDIMLSRQRANSTASLKNQSSVSDQSISGIGNETKKSNQMYSIVRLRRNWKSAVRKVLDSLETILDDSNYDYLRGPVTRLLGLLCTSGVSAGELRHIITFASQRNASPMTQLLLVRALRTAAAGASRSLLGKADPRTFFSFLSGTGIVRTINLEKSSWPFKNDFGMALWFRAESFKDSSTLLRVTNEAGDGTEVSLLPLSKADSGSATATVLAISILEGGKSVECVKVQNCILHERVWYHVAVRHTRSRLKGMFSLGSREQLSVMLDGKVMATETLKFPLIRDSSSRSLTLTFGANFDGQTGALYVFHNNVSDATLKALHGITSEITNSSFSRRASGHGDWDSRQGEIVKKSKILDLNMRRDDMEDVVLSYRVDGQDNRWFVPVSDLDEEDESLENSPLSKSSFNARLYVVWDPKRTVGTVALELHSGAHARMDPENVQQWTVEGVQDVVGSLGGIQVVLPILRSLFSGKVEDSWSDGGDERSTLQRCLLCSAVPDSVLLLSALVRDHNENAREMLRCGAIDLLEQVLQSNKQYGIEKPHRFPAPSLVSSACIFPSLSYCLVSALLELRSTCSHYVGLETKVFSKLLFNLPLWLGGPCRGIALLPEILPFLSSVARQYPDKIRDCVGVKGILKVIVDLVEVDVSSPDCFIF